MIDSPMLQNRRVKAFTKNVSQLGNILGGITDQPIKANTINIKIHIEKSGL